MNRLTVANLHKSYDGIIVISGASFTLPAGEICGLLGANGSGKSTLMRCISGIETADRGTITINGRILTREDTEVRRHFGYASAPESLPDDLSGSDCLATVARIRGVSDWRAHISADADALGLSPWLPRPAGVYSLGTRQKLSLLLACLGQPSLILLDETLNGLDPVAGYEARQMLRRRCEAGASVLVSTHNVAEMGTWFDRVLLLNGEIRRHWSPQDLQALREDPARSLELEVVETLRHRD